MNNQFIITNRCVYNNIKIFFNISLFLFFSQTIFLHNSHCVNLSTLTEDEKNQIVTNMRNSPDKIARCANNVSRDHMEGNTKNIAKSYFFNSVKPINTLIKNVLDNYDEKKVNEARQAMVLVKSFPVDQGMAVYPNPNGSNARAPIGIDPAGTFSGVVTIHNPGFDSSRDPSPNVEVGSNRIALVIGLLNIESSPTFVPQAATLMTFYPQIP